VYQPTPRTQADRLDAWAKVRKCFLQFRDAAAFIKHGIETVVIAGILKVDVCVLKPGQHQAAFGVDDAWCAELASARTSALLPTARMRPSRMASAPAGAGQRFHGENRTVDDDACRLS
jgi:hypothetical protein